MLQAPAPPADTLRLSLDGAHRIAHEANPTLRAAQADAAAAAQGPLEASRAFLPSLDVGVQGMRTTDPVAVFGLKLRQAGFTENDLGLDPLNRPEPYSGYVTSATVQLPLLAPEGLFGYAAARKASAAQRAGAERAAGATTLHVTQAYWGTQLAALGVRALEEALEAARAHEAQAAALQDQGMVTGLDARMARLGAAEIEARLVAAEAEAENARSALLMLLALPDSQPLLLTDSLEGPPPTACPAEAGDCDLSHRRDLEALRLGSEAAGAGVRRAWASNLPSLALFGSVAHYGKSSPWGGGSGDWTVGVGLSWKPLQGLGGWGRVRRAEAERDAAVARAEAAGRHAELEVLEARRLVGAASRRLTVAEAAEVEAEEALAQARLRYRTGAAPITELLDVQAAATRAALNALAARHDLFVAQASLDFAFGAFDR